MLVEGVFKEHFTKVVTAILGDFSLLFLVAMVLEGEDEGER